MQILDREPAAQIQDLGLQLFKIKILDQTGNRERAAISLEKLIELYPKEAVLRELLVKYLVAQNRQDDAEKQLRAWADANPTDVDIGLNLVGFLRQVKGSDAARQELVTRIGAGGQVFKYQLGLADLYLADGNFNDGLKLLENLTRSASSPDNALAAQIKLAQLYFSRKKYDAADTLVSEILRKDSANTAGLELRASIRMVYGQLDAAVADLRRALNDHPRSAELMLVLASAYERSGSIELAEKQFADATRTSDFDPRVGLEYVRFLARRGNVDRAEDILIELASRWPNNIVILSALADVKLTRQNWAGAQEVAERIRRIGDNRGLADQIIAATLATNQRYDESIGIFEGAYAANPNAVQPLIDLVSVLVHAKRFDKASSLLQAALERDPSNAEAHVLMGSIQLLKNASDQASMSFRAAIEKQPKNMVGYRALAELYVRQKNHDDALKVLRAGLEQQPDSFAVRLALAGILELTRDHEGAIAEYEHMLKEESGSLIVANNLASLLADHRSDKVSLERASSLVTILRKSPVPSFKDTIGWVYYRQGDYAAAISLLEEATAALPDRPLIRYHLGMSYLALGQRAKASEHFKKAYDLSLDDDGLRAKIKAAEEKAGI